MTRGLILYSGGFDSVALLHKLIVWDKFDELIVLYENSDQMSGEYEDENAKRIFDLFKKRYSRKHKIKLIWKKEDISLDWKNCDDSNNRDVLLLTHLSTLLRHGEINNFYLGWHELNVTSLTMSNKLLKWFKKNSRDNVTINFIDEFFKGYTEHQIKVSVIRYLLSNDLFSLPYSSCLNETTEEFKKRKYWFENNPKEQEVATALISIEHFNSLTISEIFKFKTKEQVQNLYNTITNKEIEEEE